MKYCREIQGYASHVNPPFELDLNIHDTKVIAVDLDGTLTLTDTLHESVLQLLRDRPLDVFALPVWLLKGKAYLKAQITDRICLNPALLPYHSEFLVWLKEQKAAGHQLVLCSATDRRIAESVAEHLGLFDQVIASDGQTNIAGRHKRAALDKTFGTAGYDYAGNSSADIPVWEGARAAIVVNAKDSVLKQAQAVSQVETLIPPSSVPLSAWRKVFRVHQWLKNLLLFVPLLAAHQITNAQSVTTLLLAFVAFSACASAVYITNDLLDLESDRKHPRKCKRPFASGAVPILYGAILAPLLTFFALGLAFIIGSSFFVWLIAYFALTTAYSLSLKRYALIDCLTLAGLYTLRIIAGAAAINVSLSFWLLAFSTFIFLSLAFVKRYAELQVQARHGSTSAHGRGYSVSDAPLIQTLGITAGYASVLVLALYVNSDAVIQLYTQPQIIWLAVPVMLYWDSWVWFKAHRGQMHDDPIVFAIKDKASQIVGLLLASTFAAASVWGMG